MVIEGTGFGQVVAAYFYLMSLEQYWGAAHGPAGAGRWIFFHAHYSVSKFRTPWSGERPRLKTSGRSEGCCP